MKKRDQLVDDIKKKTIKLTIKEFDELISLINDLEKNLVNSKKEILEFNNINIEEDVKILIDNKYIKNMIDYKVDLIGDYWYKLNINLNKDLISPYKLNKFVIIRFKNEMSLYSFFMSKFKNIDINKFNKIDETMFFSDNKLDIIIFDSKGINKYMLIYKVFEVRNSISCEYPL